MRRKVFALVVGSDSRHHLFSGGKVWPQDEDIEF